MKLFIRPILISLLSIVIWLLAHYLNILDYLSSNDEMAISATITTLGLIYWLVAATALANVWSQWTQTENAIFHENKRKKRLSKFN